MYFVRHDPREAVGYIALLLEGYAASWYDQRFIKANIPQPKIPKELLVLIIEKFKSPLAKTNA